LGFYKDAAPTALIWLQPILILGHVV